MDAEDRDFIIRALAAHAAIVKSQEANPLELMEVYRRVIKGFADDGPKPKQQDAPTVRTADGREHVVRVRHVPDPKAMKL